MACLSICNIIPTPGTKPVAMPKGQTLVNELISMGFDIDMFVGRRLVIGYYTSISVNPERDLLEIVIPMYEPIIIHKTRFTTENTVFEC